MKEIPLGQGLTTQVGDEDCAWLWRCEWYAYGAPRDGQTYAAHTTPSGRRVFLHDAIMGLDTLEGPWLN